LHQNTYYFRKSVRIIYTGKVVSVYFFCRRQVFIFAGKDAEDGAAVIYAFFHLKGRIYYTGGSGILGLLLLNSRVGNALGIIGLTIGKNNKYLVEIAASFHHVQGRSNCQAVPVAACSFVIEYFIVFIRFFVIPVEVYDGEVS
jgi:hypothetical protein